MTYLETEIPLRALINGARAGYFRLPDAVLQGYATKERLERASAATVATTDTLQELERRLVETAQKASETELEAFDVTRLERAEAEIHARNLRHRVLRRANDEYGEKLDALLRFSLADEIYECLRASLHEVVNKARPAAQLVAEALGINVDVDLMAGAPEKVRKAYVTLRAAAERYDGIRAAQRHMHRLAGAPNLDRRNVFFEMSNTPELWPNAFDSPHDEHRDGTQFYNVLPAPPWPVEQPPHLLWLLTTEAQLWVPTGAQQDACVEEAQARAKEEKGRASVQQTQAAGF